MRGEAGLPITKQQLAQLRKTLDKIDFDRARQHEKASTRRDGHLHAWGDLAPAASAFSTSAQPAWTSWTTPT